MSLKSEANGADMLIDGNRFDNYQLGEDHVVQVERSLSVYGLAVKLQEGVEIKDRRYSLRKYKRCFIGKEAVDHMLAVQMALTRAAAVKLGQQMVACKLIHHVCMDHDFQDKYLFYRFNEKNMSAINFGPQIGLERRRHTSVHGRFPTEEEMRTAGLIQDRWWCFVKWRQCFVGKEVVAWMVQRGYASNPKEAVQLGKDMDAAGRIAYLGKDLGLNLPFDGGILFYKWRTPKESHSGDSFGSLKHVFFRLNSAQCCQMPSLQVEIPEQIYFMWSIKHADEWSEQVQKMAMQLDSADAHSIDKSPRQSLHLPLMLMVMELTSGVRPKSYYSVKQDLIDRFGQELFEENKAFVQKYLRRIGCRAELSKKLASGQKDGSMQKELFTLYWSTLRSDLSTIRIAQKYQRLSLEIECKEWKELKEYLGERGWGEVIAHFSRVHELVIQRVGMLDAYAKTMDQALSAELERVESNFRSKSLVAIRNRKGISKSVSLPLVSTDTTTKAILSCMSSPDISASVTDSAGSSDNNLAITSPSEEGTTTAKTYNSTSPEASTDSTLSSAATTNASKTGNTIAVITPTILGSALEVALKQSLEALTQATDKLKMFKRALDEHRRAPLTVNTARPKEARNCVLGRMAILLPLLVEDDHCDLFVKRFSLSWSERKRFDSEKQLRRLSFYALASEHASGAGRCLSFFLQFLPHLPCSKNISVSPSPSERASSALTEELRDILSLELSASKSNSEPCPPSPQITNPPSDTAEATFSLAAVAMFANFYAALLLNNLQLPFAAKDLQRVNFQGPSKRYAASTQQEITEQVCQRTASHSAVVWALAQQLLFRRIREKCPRVLELAEEEKIWEDRWRQQSRSLAERFSATELAQELGAGDCFIPVENCTDSDRWYGDAVDTLINLSEIIERLRRPNKESEKLEHGFNISVVLYTLLEVMKRIHEAAALNCSDHGTHKFLGADDFMPLLNFVCIRAHHGFTNPHFVLLVLDELMLSSTRIRPPPCCDGIAVPCASPIAIGVAKQDANTSGCRPLVECWADYSAVISEASYYCTVLRSAIGFICCSSAREASAQPDSGGLQDRKHSIVPAVPDPRVTELEVAEWIEVTPKSSLDSSCSGTEAPRIFRARDDSRSRFPTKEEMRAAGILVERERWKISSDTDRVYWVVGKTLVAWMVKQGLASSKESAVRMGQEQLERGNLMSSGYQFRDALIFYALRQGRSSASSLLHPSSRIKQRSRAEFKRCYSLDPRRLSSSTHMLSTSAPSIPFGGRLVRVKRKEKKAKEPTLETSQIILEENRKAKTLVMHLDEEMLGRYHDEAMSLTLSRETECMKQVKCIKNWVKVHQSEWS